MIRYGQPALLMLALILSGSAALGQTTEGTKPETVVKPPPTRDARAKQDTGKPATQAVNTSRLGFAYDPNAFKHTPDSPMLKRTIDLDLRDSTIRQAAEAITRASGVIIRVDDKVPTDARLTVTAQKTLLTTVLEAIALQTKLEIEPEGKGIVLRTWPILEVNGEKQVYVGRNDPWSDKWDVPRKPITSFPMTTTTGDAANPFGGLPQGVNVSTFFNPFGWTPAGTTLLTVPAGPAQDPFISPVPGTQPPTTSRTVLTSFVPMATNFMVTPLNEHSFVVAEPAVGPNNENEILLTVYRLDGAQIREVSRVFHKLALNSGLIRAVPMKDTSGGNQNPKKEGATPAGIPPFTSAPGDKKQK